MIKDIQGSGIEGLSNFRDFGARTTSAGSQIVSGRLYRSANPGGVTPEGLERLASLGIATVVDLRAEAERARAPTDFLSARLDLRTTPIEPRSSGQLRALLADGDTTAAQTRAAMIASYRAYAGEAASAFGDALSAIVDAADRPVLVHCTAGKDRTGFLVAVLQSALGVPDTVVFEDYLATNRHWDRASAAGHMPMSSDAIEPVLVADPDYLAAAFDEIVRIDGDARAFVRRATCERVTPGHLEKLIERSLQP